MPDPTSGEPALAVVQESGVGSRATRWYSGDGPPPTTLQPPPAVGDFYLVSDDNLVEGSRQTG